MIPPNFIFKYLELHCRRFAPTLFPPWGNNRAADSRPYADCATEFPERKFRCVVGAAIMSPANVANFWAEPYWPNRGSDVANIPCFNMIPPNFICKCLELHCRRNAPTLFPHRGNNRADTIRPYADVPHRTWRVFCGWLKIFEFVGAMPPNYRCKKFVVQMKVSHSPLSSKISSGRTVTHKMSSWGTSWVCIRR